MEQITQLNQKQRKRRLRAIQDVHDIVKDLLDDIKAQRTTLLAAIDEVPLDETVSKNMTISQIDDYIKCYSQVYSRVTAAQSTIQKKLQKISKLKKDKSK